MILSKPNVGLDVDLEYFTAFVGDLKKIRRFRNNLSGFKEFCAWLIKLGLGVVLACMEATGRYGHKLAEYLHSQGHQVAVVNPSFICSHKNALNRFNKTDPTDAEAIADYARCFSDKIRLWSPKRPAHQALLDVVGQIELLKKTITAFSNRGGCGLESDEVLKSNQETLDHLTSQLEQLEKVKEELFNSLPDLNEIREIADSVPGIGDVNASALAAKICFSDFKDGRALAAFLGLAPREWKSGKQSKRGKATKAGDRRLRASLRMGAVSAGSKSHSYYKEFIDRLRMKGLSEPQIFTAVARKMVMIIHALVRKKQLFDCCYEDPMKSAA